MKKLSLFSLFLFNLFSLTKKLQAQSHYPGQHEGKFTLQNKLRPAVYSFDLHDVRLLDGRFKNNMVREQKWLLSLQTNRLLHSFRTNAGVYAGLEGGYDESRKLAGWESLDCELRGHTTGHLLSGLALMYAQTGDEVYKTKADSLVVGLAEVQKALNQNGYLSAYPQELINRNIAGKSVWAPWYTLHKLYSGLIDQYLYCDNKLALDIVTQMGLWAYQKLQSISPERRKVMLRNEFGGVNESFYNLYAITGKPEFKWVAEFFYHEEVLNPLKSGEDILEKKHANTYIPKLLGLTRNYEMEGTGDGDLIASNFWNIVINRHSFVTGSNSDKEKFFKAGELSKHLTGYTGETCNVYNMLKLTKHLYSHTRHPQYIEFYEKALFNHILGQQDPQTGMVAYFLPMLAGGHKVYSTPENSFWCCVGSGFENHAKYGEGIYYKKADSLFVNLFIASELNWREKHLVLRQETIFPYSNTTKFTVQSTANHPLVLNFRHPAWASAGVEVLLNGKKIKMDKKLGNYISLNRKWQNGDVIEITFPMALKAVATPDNPNKVAFMYGPVVLAGKMGTEGMQAPAPYSNPTVHNDYYTYDYHVPTYFNSKLNIHLNNLSNELKLIDDKQLLFKVANADITLAPLSDIHRERYVVYWEVEK